MKDLIRLVFVVAVGCGDNVVGDSLDAGSRDASDHDVDAPTVQLTARDVTCQVTDAMFSERSDSSARSGNFSLLTYNVAGLPEGLSQSRPSVYSPLISPLLNRFDVVLLQENFSYNREITSALTLPYRTEPFVLSSLGDGLSNFTRFPVANCIHVPWSMCNGILDGASDCLTPKGFAVLTHELAPGVLLEIYNLHADAGRGPLDRAARRAQVAQLVAFIQTHSGTKAIIVAGDTNMDGEDGEQLDALLGGAGLTEACRELRCNDPNGLDRVMFRSSNALMLRVSNWRHDPAFVNQDGVDLSDHPAMAVDFSWVAN